MDFFTSRKIHPGFSRHLAMAGLLLLLQEPGHVLFLQPDLL